MEQKPSSTTSSITPSKSWSTLNEEEELQKKVDDVSLEADDKKTQVEEPIVVRVPELRRGGEIVVQSSDPNSPLHSVKKFDELGLSPQLLKGIYDMKYNKPSKIQETALPIILEPSAKNLIGQAQSGTGKTAAFTLCLLSRCNPQLKAPQAMVICPARELARQIGEVIVMLGKYTGLTVQMVLKEEKLPKKIEAQIIVGTPGKILESLNKRVIIPNSIKVLVFDEADVMMDMGSLGDQSIKIKKSITGNPQILLFSATYTDEVRAFAQRVVPQPCVNIQLKREELTLDAITQLYIDCKSQENKFNILADIYGYLTIGQSMIFVHTRNTATDLARKMSQAGHPVSLLHGGEDMAPSERDHVIDDFKSGKTRVLISTNVLARGIDILQVMLVINYDLPMDRNYQADHSTYIHRIGRSGRAGRKGIAINFVHDENSRKILRQLADACKKPIKEFPADKIEDLQGMLEEVKEHDRQLAERIARGEIKEDD